MGVHRRESSLANWTKGGMGVILNFGRGSEGEGKGIGVPLQGQRRWDIK